MKSENVTYAGDSKLNPVAPITHEVKIFIDTTIHVFIANVSTIGMQYNILNTLGIRMKINSSF